MGYLRNTEVPLFFILKGGMIYVGSFFFRKFRHAHHGA